MNGTYFLNSSHEMNFITKSDVMNVSRNIKLEDPLYLTVFPQCGVSGDGCQRARDFRDRGDGEGAGGRGGGGGGSEPGEAGRQAGSTQSALAGGDGAPARPTVGREAEGNQALRGGDIRR